MWIENVDNRTAESIEVLVAKVEHLNSDGTHTTVDGFVRSNLRQGSTDRERLEAFVGVIPGRGRFCDLGSIADQARPTLQEAHGARRGVDATFDLVLQTPLPLDAHRLAPGDYRIGLKIAVGNAQPIKRAAAVSVCGQWTEDTDHMFSMELGVSIPN